MEMAPARTRSSSLSSESRRQSPRRAMTCPFRAPSPCNAGCLSLLRTFARRGSQRVVPGIRVGVQEARLNLGENEPLTILLFLKGQEGHVPTRRVGSVNHPPRGTGRVGQVCFESPSSLGKLSTFPWRVNSVGAGILGGLFLLSFWFTVAARVQSRAGMVTLFLFLVRGSLSRCCCCCCFSRDL